MVRGLCTFPIRRSYKFLMKGKRLPYIVAERSVWGYRAVCLTEVHGFRIGWSEMVGLELSCYAGWSLWLYLLSKGKGHPTFLLFCSMTLGWSSFCRCWVEDHQCEDRYQNKGVSDQQAASLVLFSREHSFLISLAEGSRFGEHRK